MNVYEVLLVIHIVSGIITLLTAVVAMVSKTLELPHQWHVLSGRVFALAMTLIFLTALPLSLIKFNLFLLLVSLFSFYLMLMGWLYAIDRTGSRSKIMWIVSSCMLVICVLMLGYGVFGLLQNQFFTVPLLVFGGIGLLLARSDWQIARNGGIKGKARIAQHLTMMIGATIAAITAFLVNVVNLEGFIGIAMWLLPTLLLTPIITWQSRLVQSNTKLR
jgi:hypothetical protein